MRHLEEYPGTLDGLARSERALLRVVAEGARRPAEAFMAYQDTEDRPFMGDATAWHRLARLAEEPAPLVRRVDGAPFRGPRSPAGEPDGAFLVQEIELTEVGRQVLVGGADWAALHGVDRWLGGVRLEGRRSAWRFDPAAGRLLPAA